MSPDEPASRLFAGPIGQPSVDAGPLGVIPSLTRRQVRLGRRLGPDGSRLRPDLLLEALAETLGGTITASRFSVEWRAAGLRRPGAIAQLSWPRLSARVGLGIEPPLAHAVVDRLLGFERLPAEGRLQVTPVEWGILSFVLARGLARLDASPGPLGDWDLTLDRVGPDPFDPSGLGPVVTWRWRVEVGEAVGAVRLWMPETLLAFWLLDDAPGPLEGPIPLENFGDLASTWIAGCGSITLSKGVCSLHPGLLLLIDGAPIGGTLSRPEGRVTLSQFDESSRSTFLARFVPDGSASRLVIESGLRREPTPRRTQLMATPLESSTDSSLVAPPDIPVTLTVELGRINLPLHRLAGLKPGDILELGRHPREPVELTSGGRLVARGELVQVDAELGVRVTQIFL